jgi:hypothetical protein
MAMLVNKGLFGLNFNLNIGSIENYVIRQPESRNALEV